MPTAAQAVLRAYFHAKDENRPHLAARVFADDAVLEVVNRTATIAFPAVTQGREAITQVLVRDFGQTYDNVYSFYMQRPLAQQPAFSCGWLVAMTEKASDQFRVGCGRYDWAFDSQPPHLARRLTITIDEMRVYAPTAAAQVQQLLDDLSYPWSSLAEVKTAAARHSVFEPVLQALAHGA